MIPKLKPPSQRPLFAAVLLLRPIQIEDVDPVFQLGGLRSIHFTIQASADHLYILYLGKTNVFKYTEAVCHSLGLLFQRGSSTKTNKEQFRRL